MPTKNEVEEKEAKFKGERALFFSVCVGFVVVLSLLFFNLRNLNMAQAELERNLARQEQARDVLWANILIHRATILKLQGGFKDSSYVNAKGVIDHASEMLAKENLSSPNMDEIKEIIEKPHVTETDLLKLVAKVKTLGEQLSDKEIDISFSLKEANSKLRKSTAYMFRAELVLFIFLLGYVTLIVWLYRMRDLAVQEKNNEIRIREQIQGELDKERARGMAEAKLVALGEMAGGVAHEINNPLAIIMANIEIQKRLIQADCRDKEKIFRIADKIEVTVTRIGKIIRGLRAISRNGELDPMELVSLKQIIQDTIGICEEKFRAGGIDLIFDESKVWNLAAIKCRSTQIMQVFLNLLNNAYDAISALEEKWVMVEVQIQNENLVISLTDSGKGINPEVQNKLFQPFFTTKPVGKGTGLGLGISKGIVEDHGGTLTIDRNYSNTRFVITLPYNVAEATIKKAS